MLQEIVVILLFVGAVGYIGRLFYKSVFIKRKETCDSCPGNMPETGTHSLKK
jgi:hypothetical protein